jgi:hypothetical protein
MHRLLLMDVHIVVEGRVLMWGPVEMASPPPVQSKGKG